ncbi:MAG: tetratricopeptide repeat protein [Acidobacteriaceae bacterium]|nr:tetratricopeptide repeat protein [Acidobacteriaceae bacterium]
MSVGTSKPSLLRFGVFELDLTTEELRRSGVLVKIPRQPFRILALIASRRGQLVTREELQQEIWGNETFVDFEQGMNQCIRQIRNALGDSAGTPRYVETLPRRGYRFIFPVEEVVADPPAGAKPGEPASITPERTAAVLDIAAPHERGRQDKLRSRLLIGLSLIGVLLIAVAILRLAHRHEERSIAVLPFADMSPERNQHYLADGLAEEVRASLARIQSLRVAGRTSSSQFSGTENIESIRQKLRVATILEGSVRRQANRARITVQLINATDGFQMWSETFDRDISDIFAVEEEIARAVIRALELKLLAAASLATIPKTNNIEAYNAYLNGKYFLEQGNDESNLQKGVDYLEKATALDPGYAPAWVWLGEARINQAGSAYIPAEQGYRQARNAIERGLTLNPNMGEAHGALAEIKMLHDWDWAGAEASYARALELEPGDPGVLRGAGSLARFLGRLDDAISLYRRSVEIDPLHANTYKNLGHILYYAGQQEEAEAALKRALEITPAIAYAHAFLCHIYLAQSKLQNALVEAGKEKNPIYRLQGLALVYDALGRKNESDVNLNALIACCQKVAPYQIAEVYAFRGEADQAFEWLERAYAGRDGGITEIKGDPLLSRVKGDPRYASLLRKMRLPV